MARWTVSDGDQVMVIESDWPRVVIEIPPHARFVTENPDVIRDLRTKLGLALGSSEEPR